MLKNWRIRYICQRMLGVPRWRAAVIATLVSQKRHEAALRSAIAEVLGE